MSYLGFCDDDVNDICLVCVIWMQLIITKIEKEITKSMTALQLKSKKWYNLKIQEQILAAENKNTFLEKENRNIQKKIALKHHKMKNSIEKASYHKKIEKEVSENKQLLSYPALNKGFEN